MTNKIWRHTNWMNNFHGPLTNLNNLTKRCEKRIENRSRRNLMNNIIDPKTNLNNLKKKALMTNRIWSRGQKQKAKMRREHTHEKWHDRWQTCANCCMLACSLAGDCFISSASLSLNFLNILPSVDRSELFRFCCFLNLLFSSHDRWRVADASTIIHWALVIDSSVNCLRGIVGYERRSMTTATNTHEDATLVTFSTRMRTSGSTPACNSTFINQ